MKIIALKKHILFPLILVIVTILLVSWGSVGHKKINQNAVLSFNQQMSQFLVWGSQLVNHASDADNRKDTDPSEAPKHYIDIDAYQNFVLNNRILQDWDSIVNAFGNTAVLNEGILPWATITTVDTLRNCFFRKDWTKAVLVAADLGHYIADGHMPLHITKNYNGQLTGNTGIHSRYESTMISNYNSQIIYSGDTNLQVIQNINQYIFDYIYKNYQYKDSVLFADNFAKAAAGGNTTSSTYTLNLWNKTKGFTTILFRNASHTLAELIYTAWVQAGSPMLNSSDISDIINNKNIADINVFPNPIKESCTININLSDNCKNLILTIVDQTGKTIDIITNGNYVAGNYSFEWKPDNVLRGTYFCIFKTGNSVKTIKMVYLK